MTISVQRGSITITTTNLSATATISSIDTAYSFVRVLRAGNNNGAGDFADGGSDAAVNWMVAVELTNATTVTARRSYNGTATAEDVTIQFEVITDDTSGSLFNIRHHEIREITDGSKSVDITPTSTVVDENQLMILIGGCTEDTRYSYGSWRGVRLNDAGTVKARVTRDSNNGTDDVAFSITMIEWDSDFTVLEHVLVVDSTSSLSEQAHTVTDMGTLANCALVLGSVEADGWRRAPEATTIVAYPTATNEITTIVDQAGWVDGLEVVIYSLSHPSLSVERDWSGTGGGLSLTGTGTTVNQTIGTITLASASAQVYAASTISDPAGHNFGVFNYQITSTTNLQLTRQTGSDSVEWAYEIWDWSSIAAVTASAATGPILFTGWASSNTAAGMIHGLRVEMAMADDVCSYPGEANWTDITDYVDDNDGVHIVRGRPRDLDDFESGTMTLKLRNEDRRFEPGYAASPYGATAIRPGRPIRVRVSYQFPNQNSPTWFTRFFGYIRSAKPLYPLAGKASYLAVTAKDIFAVLARIPGPTDQATEVAVDSPVAYYKLVETSGTTATDDGSGGNDGTYAGNYALDSLAWSTVDPTRKHPLFDGATTDGVSMTLTGVTVTGAMTVTAWVRLSSVASATPSYGHTVFEIADTATNDNIAFSMAIRPGGELQYRHGSLKLLMSDPSLDEDLSTLSTWHHLALVRDASNQITGYINGVPTSAGTVDASTESPANFLTAGIATKVHNGSSSLGLNGHVGDVAVYDTALTAGRIAAIFNSDIQARVGEDAGARIGALLDKVEADPNHAEGHVPDAMRLLDVGDDTLQAATFTSTEKLLEQMVKAARSELGVTFTDASGRIVFQRRSRRTEAEVVDYFGDQKTLDPVVYFTQPASNNDQDVMSESTAALGISGDIDIRFLAKKQASAGTQKICSNWFFGLTKSWLIEIVDDELKLQVSGPGGGDSQPVATATLTSAGVGVGDWFYGRVVYDVSQTAASFFWRKSQRDDFRQIGGSVPANQTALNATVTRASMFQDVAGNLDSSVAWFEVRDGIDGTLVARCDVADAADTTAAFTGSVDGLSWDPQGANLTRTTISDRATVLDDTPERGFLGVAFDYSEERITNLAKITRTGGTEQVAQNHDSVVSYSERSVSYTLDPASDARALLIAQALANRVSDPDLVISSMSVEPRVDPSNLYPIVLDSEISDRIVVHVHPGGDFTLEPFRQDSFIEATDEQISTKEYVATWRLSPAGSSVFWALGAGELGETTILGF